MTKKKALATKKGYKLPTKPALLDFLKENPQAGKRDIAKAFGLKGELRHQLDIFLSQLKDEKDLPDKVGKKRKKNKTTTNKLPPVCVLDIFSRDVDGTLLAKPDVAEASKNAKLSSNISDNIHLTVALPPQNKPSAIGIGTRILAKIFTSKGEDKKIAPYQGRVIRVLTKQKPSILGIIQQRHRGGFYLEAIDRKQSELLLEEKNLGKASVGDLVLAEPIGNSKGGAKIGKITKIIGEKTGEKALSEIALYSHEIPVNFPSEVIDDAERANKIDILNNREDWRHIPFITIDPKSAKDHDDAVYAEKDNNVKNKNGYKIFIAIADVAAYIKPQSAMDVEARKRGNSVYFPDRVIPMLPEQISNNLCSLRENEDRPALAVEIILDANGNKITHSFHRVIMRSRAKLSYEEAQDAIDKHVEPKAENTLLSDVLQPLWAAYSSLSKARDKRQPLELNLPERKIFLDENGRVSDIRIIPRLTAHKLIEEFMIAANICAAETLKASNKPLLFRIHDSPSLAKQENLRQFLKTLGIKLGTGSAVSSERFNHILQKSSGKDYEELVNQVILRAQSQAEYSPANIGHFGLKLKNYAHFTSPIRRYADLLIHRGLISACSLGEDGLTKKEEEELAEIASEISVAERRAMVAERETKDRLIAYYLSQNVGSHFNGRINGVTRAGLFITLETTGADGLIPIATLKDVHGFKQFYHFDEAHFALIGENSGKGYQLGDKVEVELKEVQKTAGSMRFEMLSEPKKMPFSTKSFHKSARNRKAIRVSHRRR